MRLLLDTHMLLWWITDNPMLSANARELIGNPNNQIYCSLISIWELEIKRAAPSARIEYSGEQLLGFCQAYGFQILPLKAPHILQMKNLKRKAGSAPHKDPFDRIMICQAMAENMLFVTHDYKLTAYETGCIRHV